MIFCLSIMAYAQTPQDRATELKKQAQSSLNQKDYIKARYLFKKAYEAFASRENYPQAIECGVQANALYVRENFYKEGFELCRDMEQLLWTGEQNKKKVFYDLRFLINKERLQMYTALKNPAQAKIQLDKLEEMANLAKNDSLTEVLLYTKANYYYTFNQSTQGDACFRKLINQYKEKKDYAKVSDCYKNLSNIQRIQCHLKTTIVHLSQIGSDILKSGEIRQRLSHNHIFGTHPIIFQCTCDTVVQKSKVQCKVPRLCLFPLQIRVLHTLGHQITH